MRCLCLYRLITTALPGDDLIGRLASDIVVHLSNMVAYPGPLTEFLTALQPSLGAGEGPAHLVLQLHWTRLAILYRLVSSTGQLPWQLLDKVIQLCGCVSVCADSPDVLTRLLGACEDTIKSLLSEASVRFDQVSNRGAESILILFGFHFVAMGRHPLSLRVPCPVCIPVLVPRSCG